MSNEAVIDYKELYSQYDWFQKTYPSAVQNASDEFFLEGLRFTLAGISKNINTLMDKDAYFVTKIRIDLQHDLFFRISEQASSILLDKSLGNANKSFNLNKLTDLEAKIITSFNDFLYRGIEGTLEPPPPTLKRSNFDIIHLTFLMSDVAENRTAKFIISLPAVLLKPNTIVSQKPKFTNRDFVSSIIEVKIKVGTTRFSVLDLKNLEEEDIVVFDNSNLNRLGLDFRGYEKSIKLNPNLGLVMPFDKEEGDIMSDDVNNLWDTIEVEMSAEFDKVKISLGELKNIEDGLVVDLTSIYNNKVTLLVENKPIATGELVIVNDRYGVKIEEVIANKDKSVKKQKSEESVEGEDFLEESLEVTDEVSEEKVDEVVDEEDEFDYSDFELEDEDI